MQNSRVLSSVCSHKNKKTAHTHQSILLGGFQHTCRTYILHIACILSQGNPPHHTRARTHTLSFKLPGHPSTWQPPYTHTNTQIQLLIPHTWHGCQLNPSSPEVINRLFTASLQTMIEDCWKPLCFHFKPLNSFTRTLIVTSVTMRVCVYVCVLVVHNVPHVGTICCFAH